MLEVQDLEVRYGEALAVRGVSLAVREGEWVALIGPNGAGKTSLIKALLGLVPHRGAVRFLGRDLSRRPPWDRARAGLGYVPEGRRLFPKLTVEENLRAGAYTRPEAEVRAGLEEVYALFPRLAERRRQLAGTLSGGEQQMVALGRALMGRPRLLLVDEASWGLMPLAVDLVFQTLARIHREGRAILLVEQNARRALAHAQRAYVMEAGRVVLEGPAARVAQDPRVLESYVG
ncbi:ABC transporter ATP-binding protein [Marinithermus hydrothermalis]|uniref:ABC transporter related protein n=1 Tax=Marinithermus hydrothermalis (strain DSM 14884 / JCM 11576 / T1) TaxID=869210 RepID=F2NN45_MARHT|nr:ABC transporter ATP-binding protein [Marinithermus hydrothermalis]AEB12784.1 ABC transporter related protein [Marinithermus hydrothermalis DSM 14884]